MMDVQGAEYNLKESLFLESRLELVDYENRYSPNSTGWGYFPGILGNEPEKYPKTLLLAKELEALVMDKILPQAQLFQLSFVKQSKGEIKNCYGGLHLDPDASLQEGEEIERILINLNTYPRKLKFAALDRHQLRNQGVFYSRHQYSPLQFKEDIKISTLEIPGRTATQIYLLKFLASLIPHVGLTEQEGHFVASFERKIKIDPAHGQQFQFAHC